MSPSRVVVKFFIVFFIGIFQDASAVVFELDHNNFDEVVKGRSLVVVLFYAPWCGACRTALPVLSELAAAYENHKDVIFARVNAYEERILALKYEIDAFPTIVNFPYTQDGEKYKGRINFEELRKYAREEILKNEDLIKSGKKKRGEIPPRPEVLPKMQSNVKDITLDMYKEVVEDNDKHAMLSLYAPGCSDGCYVFAQVAQSFENEDNIVFASIDFTTDVRVNEHFNINKNPTFFWLPKSDKKTGSHYGGAFDAYEMVNFINDETGSARELGGQLKPKAGQIPQMDTLIKDKMDDIVSGTRMGPILETAKLILKKSNHDKKYGQAYMDILTKINEGQEVDELIREKYDEINELMTKATTKKENEELIKMRNIVGAFVDVASDILSEGEGTPQEDPVVEVPHGFHDEL